MHNFPECPEMAPEEDVDLIEAVVTCEGNLHDPDFSERFQILLGNLKSILYKSREEELLKVKKIEPWNSVRVTISIPKEAAQKLRLLAQQGSHVLKSLGILTVQVEGDQVISLTLAGQNEPTEIVLRQVSDGSSSSSASTSNSNSTSSPLSVGGEFLLPNQSSLLPQAPSGPNVPLAILSPSPSSSAFRSPNVVAPAGESIPVLPPKSILVNQPRPGGPFPFASMTHAAQTMQRTDPALTNTTSTTTTTTIKLNTNNSNPINSNNNVNNNNINNNAVNSTNFPNVPSPVVVSTTASPQSSSSLSSSVSSSSVVVSTPNVNVNNISVVSNSCSSPSSSSPLSSSVVSPSLLLTQQQGLIKSEQVSRFVLQQGIGSSNSNMTQSSHASPQSQSLQLQIVNAPPPYPGVNMNSSNPSGNLFNSVVVNHVNHHHHHQQQLQQQQIQLNSANNNNNSNNTNDNTTSYVTVSSPSASSVTFVGAPPSPAISLSSGNNNLVRSVSSPSMSSQVQLVGDTLGGHQLQQQPMSSPLLVNLLQNNETMPGSPNNNNSNNPSSQQLQQQGGQGVLNIMLPPSSGVEQQKRFILHQQLQQQRKMKRGLSLDGASLGGGGVVETGLGGLKTAGDLMRPSSAGGVTGSSQQEPMPTSQLLGSSSSSQIMDNNNMLTQITLPSSSSLSSSPMEGTTTRMSLPISVGQPRPSSDLSTTATIIQGRAIIHQGNVRVFNSGQIRAIRLTQANTSSPSSTIHFIQGKPVMTMTTAHGETLGNNSVILNGPHPVMSPSHQQQQFPLSSTICTTSSGGSTTNTFISSNQQQQLTQQQHLQQHTQAVINKQEPNVVYSSSADQSSRTFNMNPPSSSSVAINFNSSFNINNSGGSNINNIISNNNSSSSNNTFIPPSEPLSSLANHNIQQQQQRQNVVVQSHEAKSIPSQHLHQHHHHHQRSAAGFVAKLSSKESLGAGGSSSLTSSGKPRQLLINPLTGHLEPMPSESSSESDEEHADNASRRHKPISQRANKALLGNVVVRGGHHHVQHRQIVTTTTTGVTVARVVKSVDSQRLAMEACAAQAKKDRQQQQQQHNRLTVVPVTISSASGAPALTGNVPRKSREEGVVLITPKDNNKEQVPSSGVKSEKIKLRLKLEKSEPIAPAYKVDVSFVKKAEKSSISSSSSPSTTGLSSPAPTGPVGSPGEQQPRVPPLHISLRGKNSAVVVSSPRREDDNSSSPINFHNDGKSSFVPSSIKSGKRTKSRVKSSGGESDTTITAEHNMKIPAKLSRPRLSKDSSITNDGQSVVDILSINSSQSSSEDPQKANSIIGAYHSFSMPSPLSSDKAQVHSPSLPPVSSYSTGSVKDLISLGNTTAPSSIPSPTVKLKKSRRKSDPEGPNRLLPSTKQSPSSSLEINAPNNSKSVSEENFPPSTIPESSLLFQHLSKKEEGPSSTSPPTVSVAVTVSQTTVTTLTTSATPVTFPTDQRVLNTVTTTSVLTLTSTVTGASVATLSQGVSVNKPTYTPLPPAAAASAHHVVENASASVPNDTNTLPPLTQMLSAAKYTENIPKLNRENVPKDLDLAGVGALSIPEGKVVTTPPSKSPKPLPDLLAIPTTSTKAPHTTTLNSVFNDSSGAVSQVSSLPINVSINKISTPVPTLTQQSQSISSRVSSISCESSSSSSSTTGSKVLSSSSPDGKTLTSSSPQLVIQKKVESFTGGSGSMLLRTKASPPTSVLRAKNQAPRVSIGTSIDSDLPTLTPSPSLKELLEKEKCHSSVASSVSPSAATLIKESASVSLDNSDNIKAVELLPKSSPIVELVEAVSSAKVVNCETLSTISDKKEEELAVLIVQNSKEPSPVQELLIKTTKVVVEVSEPTVTVVGEKESVQPVGAEKIYIDVPLPSTVTPNAPVPFPLILPKGDEHTGAPGEDSGIDSMDALSEKSPNQGESPARKEIEQFGESQHHPVPHYGPTQSTPPQQHQYSKVIIATSNELEVQAHQNVTINVVTEGETVLPPSSSETNAPINSEAVETEKVLPIEEPMEVTAEEPPPAVPEISEAVVVEAVMSEEVVISEPGVVEQEIQKSNVLIDEHVENVVIENETKSPAVQLPEPDFSIKEDEEKVEHNPLSPQTTTESKEEKVEQPEPLTVVTEQSLPEEVDHNVMEVETSVTVTSEELPSKTQISNEIHEESSALENLMQSADENNGKTDENLKEKSSTLPPIVENTETIVETLPLKSELKTEVPAEIETPPPTEPPMAIESEKAPVVEILTTESPSEKWEVTMKKEDDELTKSSEEVTDNKPPVVIANHIDAIQELNQQAIKEQSTSEVIVTKKEILLKKDNVKVRKLKLENIVAAIGTKNIERQQQVKPEHSDASLTTETIENVTEEPIVTLNENSSTTEVTVKKSEDEKIVLEEPVKKELANEEVKVGPLDAEKCEPPPPPTRAIVTEGEVEIIKELPEGGKLEQLEPKCLPKTSNPIVVHQEADRLTASVCTTTTSTDFSSLQDEQKEIIQEKKGESCESKFPSCPQEEKLSSSDSLNIKKNAIPPVNQSQGNEVDFTPNLLKAQLSPPQIIPEGKSKAESPEISLETSASSLPSLETMPHVIQNVAAPPPISIVLPSRVATTAPSKPVPVLEPQKSVPRLKPRAKLKPQGSSSSSSVVGGRRIPDGPPKLSKATETDPRPESANPPRLEMRKVEEPIKQQGQGTPPALPPALSLLPKIQIHGVVPNQQQPMVNVSTLAAAQRTLANMIQLSKATFTQSASGGGNKIPISSAGNVQQISESLMNAIPSSSTMGSIVPLQGNVTTAAGQGQMVYAIHPNMSLPANISHLTQSHGQSAITVLPGGQKIVPLKLVTIPRQSTGQFQTIPLTSITSNSRASPSQNLLEAVNLVANAGSRSNSPKTINLSGNSIQTPSGPINLSSVSLAAGGNLHLVASSVGGTSSPVKVLVSQPIKLNQQQQSIHQPMVVKSVVIPGQAGATAIRVVRPLVDTPPVQQQQQIATTNKPQPEEQPKQQAKAVATTESVSVAPKEKPEEVLPAKAEVNVASSGRSSKSNTVVAEKPPTSSIFKHVDGLEILDAGLPQMNDDDFPYEADIIHDEKDLEDVLAGESVETVVQENGIDSPYDFAIEETKVTKEKSPGSYTSHGIKKQHESSYGKSLLKEQEQKVINCAVKKDQSEEKDETDFSSPDSPIPVMRSSSPLYTYGNRSSRNSRPSTRSPSPTESDVHGEDQEIIDSFTRSPSQPKLSPQNKPLVDNNEEEDVDDESDESKPDLLRNSRGGRTLNQELSIEIPPVDLMVMSPGQNNTQQPTEERKSTRSTRSNTRLVSPDITAFRSDTPKLSKFSSKPDPLILRNSPKPSPTGSIKVLSPTVSGLVITPSSSNRSSPILPNQTAAVNANHVNSISSGIIMDKITNSKGIKAAVSKRKRQESDSSSASKDENNEEKIEIDLNSRPGKRRCSENAAELIKACIGVEDTPKRNSMLIKRMEESKLKEAKLKKALATLVEEKEDDNESVESILSRGRGRSSRASSEDRSSSRGSSTQRNSTASAKVSVKDEDHSKEQKASHKANNRTVKEKPRNLSETEEGVNQNVSADKGVKTIRKGITKRFIRTPLSKDMSPLTPAKTRTNVRKEVASKMGSDKSVETPGSGTTTSSPPETENLRRKTRSSAAVETPDTEISSLKRRRISKDTKS